MLSLAALGLTHSFVYAEVGIHPDGALPRQISPRMWLVRNGTKYLGFGGIQLKYYSGRWWGSRQRMGVTLEK